MKIADHICLPHIWKFFFALTLVVCMRMMSEVQAQDIMQELMDNIRKNVDDLDAKEEYKIAYNVIRDTIQANYSAETMEYALNHAEKHLSRLVPLNTTTKKTEFNAPPEITTEQGLKIEWNFFREYFGESLLNYGIIGIGPIKGTINGGREIFKNVREIDDYNRQLAESQIFKTISKEDAVKVVNQYDLLRDNVKYYIAFLEKMYPVNASNEDKTAFLNLKNRAEKLKDSILNARSTYVSYVIVSPYLADASKQIYIASSMWTRFDDKQKIKEVVINLTTAFHTEWLDTSEQDVRLQFIDVLTALKSLVGSEKWAEFQVLSTMLDSNDPSKKRGALAWWNE